MFIVVIIFAYRYNKIKSIIKERKKALFSVQHFPASMIADVSDAVAMIVHVRPRRPRPFVKVTPQLVIIIPLTVSNH